MSTIKILPANSFIAILLMLMVFSTFKTKAQIYLDSTQTIEARVENLLQMMTLEEKIGQMIQAERQVFLNNNDITEYFIGSLLSGGGSAPMNNTGEGWADMYDSFQSQALNTRLKIPIIYGVDAVHGHNNVKNAVIFPHNIGLGCTRNPELVRQVAEITANEIKGTGLNWTFAPCIAVVRNERWGRSYEGFGESTDLVSQMGVASVKGLQGDSLNGKSSILACAKHYIGDGATNNGQDQGEAVFDEAVLRQLYLPPYIEAINAGVGSIMISYSSWNGMKMHMHKYLITDVLKDELGFDGFIISDYAGIDQLPGTYADKVEASVNAGIDMIMLPHNYVEFSETLKTLVNQNKVSVSRINDAVRRVLRIKFKAGLFEHPYSDRTYTSLIGSQAHRQVARESVRQSMVLLAKKDNILPLAKGGMKIHVAGKNANDIGNQCGGWTIAWQGSSGDITEGTTILEAIQKVSGPGNVSFSTDGSGVAGADIAIAVIGETPYAEYQGDRIILNLSTEDVATVRNLKSAGIPVIVILISGRPLLINDIIPFSDAVFAAWLPGTEGDGIADVLFGDFQPTGKLSNSWPVSMEQIPVNIGDELYAPLFEYGHGIQSLQNSETGSSPDYYSSYVTVEGNKIAVSFTKDMILPGTNLTGFTVKVNSTTVSISSAALVPSEPGTIILEVNGKIKSGDKVTISYNNGSLTSTDGGVLQPFGQKNVYNLLNENLVHEIPGKVEAENFYSMLGIQTENSSDIGGGLNVGWMDSGDWMEYLLNVPVNGIYKVEFRIASMSTPGEFEWLVSDSSLFRIQLPVTGGWQNWQTVSTTCKMKKGLGNYRLKVTKGGMNLNWINFILSYEIPDDDNDTIKDYNLSQNYPNPLSTSTTIKYNIPKAGNVSIVLYDISGRQVGVLLNDFKQPGAYEAELDVNTFKLTNGTYICEMTAGDNRKRIKMIVK